MKPAKSNNPTQRFHIYNLSCESNQNITSQYETSAVLDAVNTEAVLAECTSD